MQPADAGVLDIPRAYQHKVRFRRARRLHKVTDTRVKHVRPYGQCRIKVGAIDATALGPFKK